MDSATPPSAAATAVADARGANGRAGSGGDARGVAVARGGGRAEDRDEWRATSCPPAGARLRVAAAFGAQKGRSVIKLRWTDEVDRDPVRNSDEPVYGDQFEGQFRSAMVLEIARYLRHRGGLP